MTSASRPRLRTFRPLATLRTAPPGPGYEIRAQADSDTAEVLLYDEIGGWWGVEAAAFVRDLMAIDATSINVHINSPGGSIYDGLAMYQALRNHKARITTYVDGLAASAAGVVALAGDKRVIGPYGTFMVHNPWGVCIGDSDDMAAAASDLNRIADQMAALYASRAGGEPAEWREVMSAETWYTAGEAVTAGLMHEQQEDAEKPDRDEDDDERMKARWDLTVFAYAGREQAPPPRIPGAPHPNAGLRPDTKLPAAEPVQPTTEEDMVSTLNAEVRQWLGLADDPDDTAIVAAVQARQSEHETLTAKLADLETRATAAEKALADKTKASADEAEKIHLLTEQVASMGTELAQIRADKAAATKSAVLDGALADGKFTPDDRATWEARYNKAPEVTTEVLASIPAGSAMPVSAVGHTGPAEPAAGSDAEWARIEAELWGPNAATSKGV